MNEEIFSALPRIANAVFCQPWMIRPSYHADVLVPRLRAAVENPDRHRPRAWGDEESEEERRARQERARNEKMVAMRGEWLVNEKNRRAKIAYNMDSGSMIGQVLVSGVVGKGLSTFDMDCGGVCVDQMQTALEHLAELKARKIALHFDTPGGTVTGVPEAAEFIADLSANTVPVHAYTDTMCCSAGYYLGSACASFTAAPSAEIGSIGVYCAVLDSSEYFEKAGLKMHLCASGWAKGQGMRGVPVSAEFLAEVRADVMRHANRFFSQVVRGRAAQIEAEAGDLKLEPAIHAGNIMQGQHWAAMDGPRSLHDGLLANRAAHIRALARAA